MSVVQQDAGIKHRYAGIKHRVAGIQHRFAGTPNPRVKGRPDGCLRAAVWLAVVKGVVRRFLPILMMLAMLLVIYRRILAGRVLAGGDLQVYFYPYWTQVVRLLQQGQVPLWNPTLFAGAPLAANSQVGLFYPPNWIFWLAASWWPGAQRLLMVVARSLHLSALLHIWLAGLTGYLLSRRHGLGRWSASAVGLIYGGSGFLGVHTDHLNQLQALAWAPLLFLPSIQVRRSERVVVVPSGLAVLALSMILLSGHMQMAFIGAVGIIVWCALEVGGRWLRTRQGRWGRAAVGRLFGWGLVFMLPFVLSGLLAGVQILPTMQLAGLSGRSVGLGWREAVSFSVPPWELPRVLLPAYAISPLFPEWAPLHLEAVAYLGVLGLFAAVVGGGAVFGAGQVRRQRAPWLVMCGVGLFLALGAYNPLYLTAARLHVPGFIHFRAPARFLALYVLGASVLAGMGIHDLNRRFADAPVLRRSGIAYTGGALLIIAIGVELSLAAVALPHSDATAARAYWDLRPATAHLVSGRELAEAAGQAPGRFLSISQMLFEVGDKVEMAIAYGDALSPDALWSYMVAAKQREILAPNLPLVFDVPAVDGYDGGLLPLRHFIDFSELLVPGGTLDGRLREALTQIPDDRWLDLLDVRYLLTDKTGDVWVDDVLYDQQFRPTLAAGERLVIGWLPADFAANAVRVLHEGGPIRVEILLADGRFRRARLLDGETSSVRWTDPVPVQALSIVAEGDIVRLQAASLVDERVAAFYPVTLSRHFWLAHSGDVKIYERVVAPSRTTALHDCALVDTVDAALEVMAGPSFDPSETMVVLRDNDKAGVCVPGGRGTADAAASDSASVVAYTAHEVVADVSLKAPGYLLLKDAWYPGWQASVAEAGDADEAGRPAPLLRADLLFRAVALDAGRWRVTIRYVPRILHYGLIMTVCGLALLALYGRALSRRRQVEVR
jgi:hypothetical protein